jgi:hypothetical protein
VQGPIKDGMDQSIHKQYWMLACSNSKLEQITSDKRTQNLRDILHLPSQQDKHFPGNQYYLSRSDL